MGRGCPSVEVVENIRSGANKLWLERVVARTSSSFLLEGLWIPATPSNKKANLCDWGVHRQGDRGGALERHATIISL
jgi:hypothetical protein